MTITCERCGESFEAPIFRAYCDDCLAHYRAVREAVHRRQRPAPGVCADGKFTDDPCPRSVTDPVTGRPVCGLCGSDALDCGYGLGSGYGMGSYTWCDGCGSFLDFCEDWE